MTVLTILALSLLAVIIVFGVWVTYLRDTLYDERARNKWLNQQIRSRASNVEQIARIRDACLAFVLHRIFDGHRSLLFGPIGDCGVELFQDEDTTVGVAITVPRRQLKRWLLCAFESSPSYWYVNEAMIIRMYKSLEDDEQARRVAAKKVLGLDLELMYAVDQHGPELLDIYLVPTDLLSKRNPGGFWGELRNRILTDSGPHNDLAYIE